MKTNPDIDLLNSRLDSLRLPFLKEQCQAMAATATTLIRKKRRRTL